MTRSSREVLHALIDKSLVQRAGADRFGFHPLIKQYAGEKLRQLGHYGETRGRHLDYFLALAEVGEEELEEPFPVLPVAVGASVVTAVLVAAAVGTAVALAPRTGRAVIGVTAP